MNRYRTMIVVMVGKIETHLNKSGVFFEESAEKLRQAVDEPLILTSSIPVGGDKVGVSILSQ